MNRQEIRDSFRAENPEVTDRVITDSVLNTWIDKANLEVSAMTRCIVSNQPETITAIIGTQSYDLELEITNFLDIDDMPGGGVYYNDVPLKKATASEMNRISSTWRTAADGTPKRWWRRGKYLWFDKAPDDDLIISLDCCYNASPLSSDLSTPFNGLGHLQAYSDGISKYLEIRCKQKLGKWGEAAEAQKAYMTYLVNMKRQISGYSNRAIAIVPGDRVSGVNR